MFSNIRSHKVFGIPFVDIFLYVLVFIAFLIICVPDNYSNIYFDKFIKFVSYYIPMVEHLADKSGFISVTKIVLSFVWISGVSFGLIYNANLFINYKKETKRCNFSDKRMGYLFIVPVISMYLLFFFTEFGDKNIGEYGLYASQFIHSLTSTKIGLFINSYIVFVMVFSVVFLFCVCISVLSICVYNNFLNGKEEHGRE